LTYESKQVLAFSGLIEETADELVAHSKMIRPRNIPIIDCGCLKMDI
jgi:hypothetical protein